MRSAVIGVGDMGLKLVRCLLRAGHEVVVFDTRTEARAKAAEHGATPAATLQEAVRGVHAVSVVVLDDAQVCNLIEGPGGLLSLLDSSQTIVIHSTVSPATAAKLAQTAAERGIALIDAPVAGAGVRADTGTLAVLVGGEPEHVYRCKPLLESFGTVYFLGPAGTGQVAKLANNMVVAATKAALYEAFSMTRAFGMEDAAARQALLAGSASSFLLENWPYFESLLVGHTLAGSPDFISFMTKDIRSAVEAASSKGLDMNVASAASVALPNLLRRRIAELDSSAWRKWDKHSIVHNTTMTFDAGDPLNGSLYLCSFGQPASPGMPEAVPTLRQAALWSDAVPKVVPEAQKAAYEQQLNLVEYHLIDEGTLVARFDHPKFPSNAERFSQWKAELSRPDSARNDGAGS